MGSTIIIPSGTLDNVPGASGPSQGNGHLVYAVNAGNWWFFTWANKVDSGTATSGTTGQLNDTGKSWTAGVHLGRTCIITSGTGAGESFMIGSNTATGLPVIDDGGAATLGTAPASGSVYEIMDSDLVRAYVSSGPDLSTATWSEATGSPTPTIKTASNNTGYGIGIHGGSINVGGAGQYPTDGRILQVGYANVGGVDVFLLSVQMDSHYFQITMRGRLTAATTIAWDGVITGTTNNWNDTATGMDCVPQFPQGSTVGYSSTGRWWTMGDQNGRQACGYAANSADPGTANFNENWQSNQGATAPSSFDTGTGDTCQSALIPLASGFMLAVYCNGNTASPAGAGQATQTGLHFAESASATQWPTTSTGAAVPNLSAGTNDPNDWGIVARTNADIHVVRRNAATTLEHVTYSGHGGSWSAKDTLPSTGLTGHLAGSGIALVSDGTSVWCFVIDTDANHSIRYIKRSGGSWDTSWSTLSTNNNPKNYICAYMRSDNNQVGVVWTENSSTPFAVSVSALTFATPGGLWIVTKAQAPVTAKYGSMLFEKQVWQYLHRSRVLGGAPANVTLSLTAADSITQITDSALRLITQPRTAADSTQLSDAAVRSLQAFVRTAADSITQVTDAAVRLVTQPRTAADSTQLSDVAVRSLQAFVRAAADSITQVTDAAVRLVTQPRTASDSIIQITDAAVRSAMILARTASDSIAQITDAAVRSVQVFVRTAADSITAITDSAILGGVHNLTRTASDSITQVSDSAVRNAMGFIRAAADSTQLSDAVVRALSLARAVADSTQLSDVAARAIQVFARTAVDATSLAETAVRVVGRPRTAADAMTAISEVAIMARGVARTASDNVAAISDTAVRAAQALVRSTADMLASIGENVLALPGGTSARRLVIVLGRPMTSWVVRVLGGSWGTGRVSSDDWDAEEDEIG